MLNNNGIKIIGAVIVFYAILILPNVLAQEKPKKKTRSAFQEKEKVHVDSTTIKLKKLQQDLKQQNAAMDSLLLEKAK